MRAENQSRKVRGRQHETGKGIIVPARRVKRPCHCRMRCYEKFSEPVRKQLLSNLLKLTSSGQHQFISSHMTIIRTVRPKVLISSRARKRIYNLPGVGGPVKVCKQMFRTTLDLTDRKLRTFAHKLVLDSGIARDDMRMNNQSSRKVTVEHASYIKNHIRSFPSEESHYGREKSSCLYLSSDLDIRRMYQLYQNQCDMDNLIPVHYNTYRLAFNSMNLKFRKPRIDTCNTCDTFDVELRIEKYETERNEIIARKKAHHDEANSVYHEKRQDRARADEDASVRTISFDLQKQLATPYLTCDRSFYSRQLYTYNLTIFETQVDINVPTCYMWDETRAKRGSREIGSCLWSYLKSLPAYVQEVNMYSDSCAGQNNNRIVLFYYGILC
ncbi:uncharacterized protein LOC129769426 isoform X3 [Toxorhynchites rutilus septentrionalis]|uniref:uncharacterized protein LOC129769426 isoform X3 n=1 Tax=Toxorhynchites rutilus septentrionalis TaxID=329112 RepID=UPI002479DEE6|nr:uncharacterized protein LOC129769426 isoform X3 [Toxorhynchites rutilus septentrionalis]